MSIERWLPRLFMGVLLVMLAVAGWQWHRGAPLSADLMSLVPGASDDPLVTRAEQRMQAPLNQQLLVLVGHTDRAEAIAAAERLAVQWQASGVFERVQWNVQADLPALRQQLLASRLALLPAADRQQLIEQPEAFIQGRIQTLFDSFAGYDLVPAEQDWLGLSGRVQRGQPIPQQLALDSASGALVAQADGRYWVMVRAQTAQTAFDLNLPVHVAALLATARTEGERQGVRLLAASGLLHAAAGQRQASQEITWVGGGATLGILALLLLTLRRWRVLLALTPVLVGMLFGSVACIALFGTMHVMTLILGASLIGVAVDYPLHYLTKAWSLRPWHSWHALRLTVSGLSLSLATSCIGYLALAFTPFPALTQIAVFSAAGLIGAYLCAVCVLPAWLSGVDLRPAQWPLRLTQGLLDARERLLQRVPSSLLFAAVLLFCALGLWRLDTRNDIRQWVGTPPALLSEAQAIARITGFQPTSQFFLVQAPDVPGLFERLGALQTRLDAAVAEGQLQDYRSLGKWLASPDQQARLQAALPALRAHAGPLLELGVPSAALDQEITQLQALPQTDIDAALAGPLGEAWRPLWLGPDDGGVAALVSLQGLHDSAALARDTEGLPGVRLIDRLGELNRLFAATQVSAVELKLLSCVLIFALLLWAFGRTAAVRLVALPLLAALCSLACLGWLGQPLTLFSVFGLLLVTAISVDYGIIVREAVGGAAVSLLGTLLAAVTTWLSFGLLALSSTPAVSNFGLAVSLGLFFSFLLAPWAASRKGATA